MQREVIRDATASWRAAAVDGDAERYLEFWADDAVLVAPDLEPMVGKTVITDFIRGVFDAISVTEVLENADPVVSGDLGYVWGTYVATYTARFDGSETPDWGNHLFLWHRQPDGAWKLGFVTWNTKPEPAGQ
jgi:uncharacterized protein (TIGR02246 family)